MGILHDELAKLKAAAGRAFDFADPAKHLEEAEAAFQKAIVGAFHGLEERVDTIEQRLEEAFAPKPDAVVTDKISAPEAGAVQEPAPAASQSGGEPDPNANPQP